MRARGNYDIYMMIAFFAVISGRLISSIKFVVFLLHFLLSTTAAVAVDVVVI